MRKPLACLVVAVVVASSSALAADDGDPASWPVFTSTEFGFSISHPKEWSVDPAFTYTGLGPDKAIDGVSFTIPSVMAKGTNLSLDSHFSVEVLPETKKCTAAAFLPDGIDAPKIMEEDGTSWSVATMQDAGAGNFYDETAYAIPGTSPCVAVRYSIHSTNIANYDPGTVKEFDRDALVATFDEMRLSLVIGQ